MRKTMSLLLLYLLQLLGCCIWSSDAYKILIIPAPGKSHVFALAAIAEQLANSGHPVSLLLGNHFAIHLPELESRPGKQDVRIVRYTDSDPGTEMDYDRKHEKVSASMMEGKDDFFGMIPHMRPIVSELCRHITDNNEELFEQLEKEQFDLAVVDQYVLMKCLFLIPHRLGIPWVTTSMVADLALVRTPWLPSFVPHVLVPLTERMTFMERLLNTWKTVAYSMIPDGTSPDVMQRYQQYGSFGHIDELISKSFITFLTLNDIALDYAKPMMPNMIPLGGLTAKRATGGEVKLPSRMEEFIKVAERGVILVTFGTLASEFPAEIVGKFARVFGQLAGYRILWRLNNRDDVPLPENVLIDGWLPQNDILAHGSVRLFITHCGNNGQFEAIYHGVPMIGFPIRGDQAYNAKRMEYRGYGLTMSLSTFTEKELLENIWIILGDPEYSRRVKKASEIFRSQQSPAERAVYWIEHVCKFGGEHLRSAGNDLPLYSYLLLDILTVFVAISAVVVILLVAVIRGVVRRFNRCKSKVD